MGYPVVWVRIIWFLESFQLQEIESAGLAILLQVAPHLIFVLYWILLSVSLFHFMCAFRNHFLYFWNFNPQNTR
jgi:hypothetical protein